MIAYVAGISVVLSGTWYVPAGLLLIFAWMHREAVKRHQFGLPLKLLAVCILFFLAGRYQTQRELDYRNRYLSCLEDEAPAILQGKIWKKEKKDEQYLIYLKDVSLRINNSDYSTNQVLLYLDTDDYSIGKTIVAEGKIRIFQEASNEGGFNQLAYYQSQKIDYRFELQRLCGCYGTENRILENIYRLSEKLKQNYKKLTSEKYAAILSTMILGDKYALDAETKTMYQRAGISHVLVISGLHILMIGMLLYGILRRCRGGFLSSLLLSGIFLMFYAQLTGWGVSTLRAVLMFALAMLAKWSGRTYDRMTALAAAVFLILLENPFLLTYSGFQLSVAAIVGIILAGEQAKAWEMSAMIQFMTMPLLLYSFSEIPIWSLPVNMLILPSSGCLLLSGIAGTAAGCISTGLGKLLLFPAYLILWFYEKVCQLVEHLPVSMWILGHPALWQVVLYYLVLIAGALYLQKKREVLNRPAKKKKAEQKITKQKITGQKMSERKIPEQKMPYRVITAVQNRGTFIRKILWLVTLIALLAFRFPQPTTIDVLDVGQGDGICLRLKSGNTVFIDGGSTDVSQVGKYRLLPYLKYHGMAEVDYWFVSHFDTDHMSGLLELLESGYPVGSLVVAKSAVENENSEELFAAAKENHTKLLFLNRGERFFMGESTFTCLFPETDYVSTDTNARSMVLLFEEGDFRGLLTGDISEKEEEWMLAHEKLPKLTWYKAAHHGSKYSNSEAWLAQLLPVVATISYGEDNRYGHPAEEAVEHMEEAGSELFATAKQGEISLILQETSLQIRNYRNPLEVRTYPVLK